MPITPPKLILRGRRNARKEAQVTKLAPVKRSKPTENSLVWIDDTGCSWEPGFPDGDFTDCVSLQPYQQFEKFFDAAVIKVLQSLSPNFNSHPIINFLPYCLHINVT